MDGKINGKDVPGNRSAVEPVRSRWTPKQEQIMILESIFNSGMVNPPKEETIRIRKLLEKFGPVGDANVFYWFQNRRSRSRRRQRQIQTEQQQQQKNKLEKTTTHYYTTHNNNNNNNNIIYQNQTTSTSVSPNSGPPAILYEAPAVVAGSGITNFGFGSASGFEDHIIYNNNNYSISQNQMCNFPGIVDHQQQQQQQQHNYYSGGLAMDISNSLFHHHSSGLITVFINGIQTDVPNGAIDMKAMFGDQNCVLVHSSGITVPYNEYGFLLQTLQHGETYFLVSRGT